MTVVKHPRLPGVSRDVTDPEKWVAAGWVVDPPAEAPRSDHPLPANEPKSSSRPRRAASAASGRLEKVPKDIFLPE